MAGNNNNNNSSDDTTAATTTVTTATAATGGAKAGSKSSNNYHDDNDHNSSKPGKSRAHVLVSGKVQGVYFRQNTMQVAAGHGVKGWVQNLPDGRVEAVLEGDGADVGKVVEWCHVGPPRAKVEDVQVKYEKYTGEFAEFSINY